MIVEQFIQGREFTVGVFEANKKIIPLPITEIKTKNTFFDFNAKYNGQALEITPAHITADLKKKLHQEAIKIYQAFNCAGVVRIDFIVTEKQIPYMLEINTIPGQTTASFIPQQVKAFGWTLQKFYHHIIQNVLDKQ